MNYDQIPSIARLIDEFNRLPGIGRKSAQRLAYHILDMKEIDVRKLAHVILETKRTIHHCSICGNYTETDPCKICSNAERQKNIICVVEEPKDVFAMERTRDFTGQYHVLHGAISPLDGIGPEDINLASLLKRLDGVSEVVLATNSTIEGEATAMYIAKLLKPLGIVVSRIAHGVPVGGDIDLADEITLSKALEGRREL